MGVKIKGVTKGGACMNHPLLAIQHVTLSWNKGERGVRGKTHAVNFHWHIRWRLL